MKIIISKKTKKKYLVKDTSSEFHTSDGVISKKELQGSVAKTNKGKEFFVLEPNFVDFWEFFKRGPQIVLQKDIGLIITKTGLNKNSLVVDAGGGTGSLSCYLANVVKEVTAYEIQKDLIPVLEHNKKLVNLTNLKIKNKSIYEGISEKNLDLITLDLAQPWQVLEHAEKSLKSGGFLVVYLPNLIQMRMFLDVLKRSLITFLELEEVIERKWKVEDRILRPEYDMLGHTGFLCFCRKF